MKAIEFPGCNAFLGPPPGMTEEQCFNLPCMRGDVEQRPVTISCWQLTPEEVNQFVKSGGKLYLWVLGGGMPPVILTVEEPETSEVSYKV